MSDLIEIKKPLRAIYGSDKTPLKLGAVEIPCYVLEDGTRVLSGRGLQSVLGSTSKSGQWLKGFINKKSIFPFFYAGVLDLLNNPIPFTRPDAGGSQSITYGYEATLLIDLIDAIIDAERAGVLIDQIIVESAHILSKSLKRLSIIALIDEATGYQYEREKEALQTILKELIDDEINPRRDTFPLSFYREIFRLWGIPFTEKNIKRKPRFIGHITNRFVYLNMPAGTYILEKIKGKTPKTKGGNYKFRFHQSLTPEKGWEELRKVIYAVEALASISDTKDKFKHWINEKYGQRMLFSYDELDALSKENDEIKNGLNIPDNLIEKANFGQLLGAVTKAGKPKDEK
ncbi:P63C domain-containing protein [uncultured Mucilaginibacter sp.]|uniref:P63C domain-containing protein n=1 Tax=uncultured Mucilaginibacter sp. TaxID=797541 RepID=UPI0025FC508F|nr:P63C domain-containing protein [uncultured Mucilaginibacter sp.]